MIIIRTLLTIVSDLKLKKPIWLFFNNLVFFYLWVKIDTSSPHIPHSTPSLESRIPLRFPRFPQGSPQGPQLIEETDLPSLRLDAHPIAFLLLSIISSPQDSAVCAKAHFVPQYLHNWLLPNFMTWGCASVTEAVFILHDQIPMSVLIAELFRKLCIRNS